MGSSVRVVLQSIGFFLLVVLPVLAGERREPNVPRGSVCLIQALDRLAEPSVPGLSRSAELEIGAHLVWPHLTTEDGTLGSLVGFYGDEWFKRRFPDKTPQEVRWESLSHETQKSILNEITQGQRFFEERKIIGLKLKASPQSPLKDFQPYVELGGPSDAGNVVSLELHLRSPQSASQVARDTRAAAKALGRDRQHLHVHIPLALDRVALEADPVVRSVEHLDYYRRTELYSQMLSVMDTHVNLAANRDGNVINFAPLKQETHQNNLKEMILSGASRKPTQRSIFSKGYVGLRGEGYYDQPGLWGIEVRAIHRSLPDSTITELLDGFEKTGASPSFGLEEGRIRRWLAEQKLLDRDIREKPFYRRSVAEDVSMKVTHRTLPPDAGYQVGPDMVFAPDSSNRERGLEALTQLVYKLERTQKGSSVKLEAWEQRLVLSKFLSANPQTRFLFHPWKTDPLFFDDPVALRRIEEAKLNAVRKLLREDPAQEVMREFLIDSGVYSQFGKSLGIQVDLIRAD